MRDLTALLSDRSIPDSRGWALVGAFIIVSSSSSLLPDRCIALTPRARQIYGVLPFVTQSYWEKVYNVR